MNAAEASQLLEAILSKRHRPAASTVPSGVRVVPAHAVPGRPLGAGAGGGGGGGNIFGPLASMFPLGAAPNAIQRECAPTLLNQDCSVVIAAPTGSGKTLLLECAIARLFATEFRAGVQVRGDSDGVASAAAVPTASPQGPPPHVRPASRPRAVYICPTKALAAERYRDWSARFGPANIRVVLETGDREYGSEAARRMQGSELSDSLLAADLIVSTPERWDSITRRWTQLGALTFVATVRLLLIDEVHVLGEARGAVLEALVSRMRTVHAEVVASGPRVQAAIRSAAAAAGGAGDAANDVVDDAVLPLPTAEVAAAALASDVMTQPLRFVAVSGTISNAGDVAQWLGCPPHALFRYTDAQRPVPLSVRVVSYPASSPNPFIFDRLLTHKLPGVLRQFSDGKPSIVFCISRRDVSTTALSLRGVYDPDLSAAARHALAEAARQVDDSILRQTLPHGIACHHAALCAADRRIVEDAFIAQHVRVLCTTTTLAMGVNLPARLVVVKNTVSFARQGGACTTQDMTLGDVAQMCGRAGRAGFDDRGVAVVMTSHAKAALYLALQTGRPPPPVESQLHRHMVEHMNAEVVLGTIPRASLAAAWLRTTFLWVRLRQNARHYAPVLDAVSAAAALALVQTGYEENAGVDSAAGAAHGNSEGHEVPTTAGAAAGGARGVGGLAADLAKADSVGIATRLARRICAQLIATDACACPEILPDLARAGFPMPPPQTDASGAVGCRGDLRHALTAIEAALAARSDDVALIPTRMGVTMCRFYLDFRTYCVFNHHAIWPAARAATDDLVACYRQPLNGVDAGPLGPPFECSVRSVLAVLARAAEFAEAARLRMGDRTALNSLNRSVRFPVHGIGRNAAGRDIRETWQKVFVLLQYVLDPSVVPQPQAAAQGGQRRFAAGDAPDDDNQGGDGDAAAAEGTGGLPFFLQNDTSRLWLAAPRLIHGLTELALLTQNAHLMVSAWRLRRCIDVGCWWDAPRLTRQLPGVGDGLSRLLAAGGITTLAHLVGRADGSCPAPDPRRLEALCSRNPPFGSLLLRACAAIPRFRLQILMDGVLLQPLAPPESALSTDTTCAGGSPVFLTLIVASPECGGRVLLHRRIPFRDSEGPWWASGPRSYAYALQCGTPTATVHAWLLHESMLGCDVAASAVLPMRVHNNVHNVPPPNACVASTGVPLPQHSAASRPSTHVTPSTSGAHSAPSAAAQAGQADDPALPPDTVVALMKQKSTTEASSPTLHPRECIVDTTTPSRVDASACELTVSPRSPSIVGGVDSPEPEPPVCAPDGQVHRARSSQRPVESPIPKSHRVTATPPQRPAAPFMERPRGFPLAASGLDAARAIAFLLSDPAAPVSQQAPRANATAQTRLAAGAVNGVFAAPSAHCEPQQRESPICARAAATAHRLSGAVLMPTLHMTETPNHRDATRSSAADATHQARVGGARDTTYIAPPRDAAAFFDSLRYAGRRRGRAESGMQRDGPLPSQAPVTVRPPAAVLRGRVEASATGGRWDSTDPDDDTPAAAHCDALYADADDAAHRSGEQWIPHATPPRAGSASACDDDDDVTNVSLFDDAIDAFGVAAAPALFSDAVPLARAGWDLRQPACIPSGEAHSGDLHEWVSQRSWQSGGRAVAGPRRAVATERRGFPRRQAHRKASISARPFPPALRVAA